MKWQTRHNPKDLKSISPLTYKSTTTTSFFNGSLILTLNILESRIFKSFILILLICALSFQSTAYAQRSSVGSVQVEGYSVSQIVNAIYRIEGGSKAVKPFGILSVKCHSYQDCKRICENTVINNIARWHRSGSNQSYFEFLANRYAPVEAHPLNKNWLPNLISVLKGGEA